MKNDAVRMLELLERINTLFAKYTEHYVLSGGKHLERTIFGIDNGDGRFCFNCVFDRQKFGTEEHPFWAELWAYLEPHVDVQGVKDTYPDIGNSKFCKDRKMSDLLRTIAEHMLPAPVLVEQ